MKFIHTSFTFGMIAMLLGGTGCTSVNVKKVEANDQATDGIRYSLPKPFVQITTQSDGTAVADIVYIPDSEKTYAITSKSYFASSNLTVGLDNGLLKKLSWTADSASVVAEGVKSYATVKEKEAAEDAKQQTTFDGKMTAAKKALADANLALALAKSDETAANEVDPDGVPLLKVDDATKLKIKMAVRQAEARVQLAEAEVRNVLGLDARAPIPGADAGSGGGASPIQIPGPLLFAVHENASGTKLVAQDATVPATAAPPKPFTVEPQGEIPVRRDKNGNFTLYLKASKKVDKVERALSSLKQADQAIIPLPPIQWSGSDINISLNGLPPGRYDLELALTSTSKVTDVVNVKIAVQL